MLPQIVSTDQMCNAVAWGVFIGIQIIGIYGIITFIKYLYNLKKPKEHHWYNFIFRGDNKNEK